MKEISRLRNTGIVAVSGLALLVGSAGLSGCDGGLRPVMVGDVIIPMTEREYKDWIESQKSDQQYLTHVYNTVKASNLTQEEKEVTIQIYDYLGKLNKRELEEYAKQYAPEKSDKQPPWLIKGELRKIDKAFFSKLRETMEKLHGPPY